MDGLTSRQVRTYRGAKRAVEPLQPLGASWERERSADGVRNAFTVFLAGAECPYACVFCDLWQHTLDGPTAVGAIPTQLERALQSAPTVPPHSTIKLYNASNFFDPRAVPPDDHPAIAALVAPFGRVVVENHPRLTTDRCRRFAEQIDGALEVAMGLETVEPRAHALLNKGTSLDDFDRAASSLARDGIALRAFVLLHPPFVDASVSVDWTVRSVAYALERGANHVTIIPTRPGNGALEHLATHGDWTAPALGDLETTLDACLGMPGVVTVDLWDAERLVSCECGSSRIARLAQINLTGQSQAGIECQRCGGSRA